MIHVKQSDRRVPRNAGKAWARDRYAQASITARLARATNFGRGGGLVRVAIDEQAAHSKTMPLRRQLRFT